MRHSSATPARNPRGSSDPDRPPGRREENLREEIADLITDGDVKTALARLRAAMDAKVSVRAPRGADKKLNDYMLADDWPTRIAAIKLTLAYKFGNPSSTLDVRSSNPALPEAPRSSEELVAELQETGADLQAILDTWFKGMKQAVATTAAGEPAQLPQPTEELSVVDV